MTTVQDILMNKDGGLRAIGVGVTVLEATLLMNRHQIGAMVVTGEGGRVAGIFTERDVLRRIVAERRDPSAVPVGEVMTGRVICCTPGQSLDEVRSIMKRERIRHLPVVDVDDGLVGMISIGDLNAWCIRDDELKIQYMEEYLYGRG